MATNTTNQTRGSKLIRLKAPPNRFRIMMNILTSKSIDPPMITPKSTLRERAFERRFLTAALTASAMSMPAAGANRTVKNPIAVVSQLPRKARTADITKATGMSYALAVSKTFC